MVNNENSNPNLGTLSPSQLKILAKPTWYNGILFRSKLEALWAEFFDDVKIKYNYELKTYKLTLTLWYIPDFWFPQLNMFGEVKPIIFDNEEEQKAKGLTKMTKLPILKLIGIPPSPRLAKEAWIKEYEVYNGENVSSFNFVNYQIDDYKEDRKYGLNECWHVNTKYNHSKTKETCCDCNRVLKFNGKSVLLSLKIMEEPK